MRTIRLTIIYSQWQSIVTYFSHLEYELINEKDQSDQLTGFVNNKNNAIGISNLINSIDLINNGNVTANLNNLNYYSCVIDRSRNVKLVNADQPAGQAVSVKALNLTPEVNSNMNVFYEIIKSMPELSKLQIR